MIQIDRGFTWTGGGTAAAGTNTMPWNTLTSGLSPGQTVSVSLPVTSAANTKLGTAAQDTVWVAYQTVTGGTWSFQQAGTLTTKAT